MKLLASTNSYNLYPYKGKFSKYQVTNKKVDRRYTADEERIGAFGTMAEAIRFMRREI